MVETDYSNGLNGVEEPAKTILVLPEELSKPSFFIFDSADHTTVIAYFVYLAQQGDTDGVTNLFSSSLLSNSPVSIPSLLARVWISPSYSVPSRTRALHLFSAHLTESDSSLDFQGFIPHLITALSDPDKEVRAAAASAVLAYETSLSRLSSKTTVVGLDDLYIEDEKLGSLKWLGLPERKWLIESVLVPKLEECRLDGSYVVRLFSEALNVTSKKHKKEQYFF
jgi:hypothetical protein